VPIIDLEKKMAYKTLRGLQRAVSNGKTITPESITEDLVEETIKKGKDITFILNLCKRMYPPSRDVNVSMVAEGYVRQIFNMYYFQNTCGFPSVVEYGGIKFTPEHTASLLKKLQHYVPGWIIKKYFREFRMVEEREENSAIRRGWLSASKRPKFIKKLEDKLRQL